MLCAGKTRCTVGNQRFWKGLMQVRGAGLVLASGLGPLMEVSVQKNGSFCSEKDMAV